MTWETLEQGRGGSDEEGARSRPSEPEVRRRVCAYLGPQSYVAVLKEGECHLVLACREEGEVSGWR